MNEIAARALRTLSILALLVTALGLPAHSAAAGPLNHYDMAVNLDYDRGTVGAVETVTYHNNSAKQLGSIVFNVTPANYNAFTLEQALAGGVKVAPTLNGVVLEVPLASPLAPGASVDIRLTFDLTIPSPGNMRFGRAGGITALGNWYPVLSRLDPRTGDWDRHKYTDVGDAFLTEVADYDLILTLNRPVSFGHTGSAEEVGNNVWKISAPRVRDFAIALSDRYVAKQTTVGNATITALYLPEHAQGGRTYLQGAAEAIKWINGAVGTYPYPNLFVVETTSNDPAWVGQEYPGIVFISSLNTAAGGDVTSYLGYLVIHETFHQWFYSAVGDDQLHEPWLDESMVTHLSYEFYRANYSAAYPDMWQRFVDGLRQGISAYGDRPVNTGVYDYRNEAHYFIIVYRKGAVFLDDLRKLMGDTTYYAFLRDYFSRYQGAIVQGTDFLDMAQSRSAADVTPLIKRNFTYGQYSGAMDYDIPQGHFFTQANGEPLGQSKKGFSVVDDGSAAFWTEYRRLGGVDGVGYPISRRFLWNGFVSQAMQKGVFQWRPEAGRAYFVNVFDEMSRRGMDDWLKAFRQTPSSVDWSSDGGRAWPEVVRSHQALLEANPAIKAAYFGVNDPVNLFGLPVAYADMGNNVTLRAQRAVIQQWKEDVPWAKAGQVTVANGGDIAKEAGLLPQEAMVVEEAP
ncbi:MAG: M1 family metallopeptidase [Chloroflexi bacterium]|nr:M1 family metallopeptidase [Chloroflexota bacterium]